MHVKNIWEAIGKGRRGASPVAIVVPVSKTSHSNQVAEIIERSQ
jgi:hypothetical protein